MIEVDYMEGVDMDTKMYTPREIARKTSCFGGDGLPITTEADVRAYTHRADNPLPSFRSGGKRPHIKIFWPVFCAFLLFEQKVASYAEVEQAARRCVMGARQ